MNSKHLLVLLFFINLFCLSSLDVGVGFDQWSRIEKTENTAIMAPGGELFFNLYPTENFEISLGIMGGRFFGTLLGGSLQGNYYFNTRDTSSWKPGIGLGLAGGYVDQIFMTTSSYDYIVPYSFGLGLQLNLMPLHFHTDWGSFSALEISLGSDFSAFFRKNHVDLRLLKFTFTF